MCGNGFSGRSVRAGELTREWARSNRSGKRGIGKKSDPLSESRSKKHTYTTVYSSTLPAFAPAHPEEGGPF